MRSVFLVILLLCITLLNACTSIEKQSVLPDFTFSDSEIKEAIKYFNRSEAEVLFLVMLDRKGYVVKSKMVAAKGSLRIEEKLEYKKFVQASRSEPAGENGPLYREILMPFTLTKSYSHY